MKTKIAAIAFTFTLLLTSFLGIYQINSAKKQANRAEQQALLKADKNPTTLYTTPKALP